MKQSSKYYWVIVALASFAVLGIVFVLGNSLQKEISAPVPGTVFKREGGARLVVDFGNGKKRAFRGEVVSGMTVYDALAAAREAGGLTVAFRGDAVEEIGGVKNNSHEWRYYVNGKPAASVPQFEEVKPGDEVVFRFE